MNKPIVRIFSHHYEVRLDNCSREMNQIVDRFASWFDKYKLEETADRWERVWECTFAIPSADIKIDWKDVVTFRFPINSLPSFKRLLEKQNAKLEDLVFVTEPIYESALASICVKKHFVPYEEQIPIFEQITRPSPVSKLLGLETGGGKTVLAIWAAAHWGYRTAAFMKPGYIEKWVNDIAKQCDISREDEVICVSGSDELIRLIDNIDRGIVNPNFILISNATFRNWISKQEEMPPGQKVPGFPIYPWEFFQHCGIGFRLIDETHQDFHANFRFDLITHIEQSLSLSATLISRDEYLMKMYRMGYPEANRMIVPPPRKFRKAMAWMYDVADIRKLRTKPRGKNSYSHVEFEKSIMKSPKLYKQYLLMIYQALRSTYFSNRKQGEKAILYFATKKMCEDVVKFFTKLMPEIRFSKYNQGDRLETALEADIIIATLQKAGTAIDIPNLTTVIMTVAIDSIQSNLQCFGRLRDLKRLYDSDRVPLFLYFVCTNIPKHVAYHRSKQEWLATRALAIDSTHHTSTLGYD